MRERTKLFLSYLKEITQQCFQKNPLRAPLGRLDDSVIDASLDGLNMDRHNLFSPEASVARHRKRISGMMSTLGIRVEPVIDQCWNELKQADQRCAYCSDVRRCEQWLSFGLGTDEPRYFCPNATFFAYLKNRQRSSTEKPRPN